VLTADFEVSATQGCQHAVVIFEDKSEAS